MLTPVQEVFKVIFTYKDAHLHRNMDGKDREVPWMDELDQYLETVKTYCAKNGGEILGCCFGDVKEKYGIPLVCFALDVTMIRCDHSFKLINAVLELPFIDQFFITESKMTLLENDADDSLSQTGSE